jgi:hypothetical protein
MGNIFKDKAEEKGVSVINIRILKVLVIRLLRQELNKLVKEIKLVKL